ncbi:MAG: hypothetical protein K2N91_03240 [Muribaculaceae bacterium]|nr:hypothetical protein [Muribaculaceae bacterium]
MKELLEDLNTPAPTPPTERELENIREMKRIVAKYEGYTAEVFDATVFGRKKVKSFRWYHPGQEVRLRRSSDAFFDVLFYGDRLTDFFVSKTSNLPRVFKEKIPYFAYLGGRSKIFRYHDDLDAGSIIVFCKVEGVRPANVYVIP